MKDSVEMFGIFQIHLFSVEIFRFEKLKIGGPICGVIRYIYYLFLWFFNVHLNFYDIILLVNVFDNKNNNNYYHIIFVTDFF